MFQSLIRMLELREKRQEAALQETRGELAGARAADQAARNASQTALPLDSPPPKAAKHS